MAIMHVVVIVAALLALLCLPCIVAAIVCADGVTGRPAWVRGRRTETRVLRRLDRSLTAGAPRATPSADPSLEEIVTDLRRLDRHRRGGLSYGSVRWSAAVLRAYDDRLRLASRYLGIAEHLRHLDGIDREIERVRVEGLLEAAGLALRYAVHPPPDRRA